MWELGINEVVVWIFLENPFGLESSYFLTVYLSDKVVCELAWVETINWLNTILVRESHLVGSFEDLIHWDI